MFSDEFNFLYSIKDRERVPELLTVQLLFMAFIGQAPYILDDFFPRCLKPIGYVLTRLYSLFIAWQTFHTGILFVKTTFDMLQRGQLNEITDALTQAIICGFSFFSTCYWLYNAEALKQYIRYINENYWHHSLAGITFVSAYEAYAKARRITQYWLFSTTAGVILWGLAPLLQGSHTLPLSCWYPFNPLQPGIYGFVYMIQMFTQVNIGVTFGCGSALYVSLIILLLGQFDVLFCSLKNIQFYASLTTGQDIEKLRAIQKRLPTPENDEVNQYLYVKEELTNLSRFVGKSSGRNIQNAYNDAIIKCVRLHRFICDCCSILEGLYHPYCLVKSLQITVQLCLLVFVGVAGERSAMRLFNLFQYLALTLTELLMFTFLGELLRQHSTRSGEALFRSEWFSYAHFMRKDLLIFLVNSKRTMKLTAGKFFVMDLERLRSVVMQAFSFLTLLQKLAAKNEKKA